jgi:two-component system, OmpR family, sensor histidine kinase BaeS
MHSLRTRLILSHVLPLMVTVPLIGLALLYVVQTQVLLANLSRELQTQAVLLMEMTSQQVDVWASPQDAQAFVTRISNELNSKVMLINPQGTLLASSDLSELPNLGKPMNLAGLADAMKGKTSMEVQNNLLSSTDVIQVLVPVLDSDQQLLGIIRLNLPVAGLLERMKSVRSLIGWVVTGGLVLGGALGWGLALSLERPLRKTTHAIDELTTGAQGKLEEEGPNELRSLIRSFNSLSLRLTTMEESRRRLLANLVHELGRPLGALHSAIEAMQRGADQDPTLRQELLSGMQSEIRRLESLLNDLARLHDQVVGTLELSRAPTQLNPWLNDILSPWREAATSKGIHWETDIPDDLPTATIDPDRLAQSVGNLLSNAVKYTPPGQKIMVNAGATSKDIWISVRDTGPGMTLTERNKIFDAFYRGPEAKRFPQGMGLGLTIANDLVQAHSGKIEVETTQGKGSQFTIRLPLNP